MYAASTGAPDRLNRAIRLLVAAAMGATLLVGTFSTPAGADDTTVTLEQLEEAVVAAQAVVDTLEGEIADLEAELVLAEAALAEAEEARDAQQLVVDGLSADLADAEAELAVAEGLLADAQAIYDACNPATSGHGNGNGCRERATEHHIEPAQAVVTLAETAVDAAEQLLADAETELETLQAVVDAAADDVAGIEEAIAAKELELETARTTLADAQTALDNYVPPATDVHPGCKGLANAASQVDAKSKGKAPVVIAAVSAKLGC